MKYLGNVNDKKQADALRTISQKLNKGYKLAVIEDRIDDRFKVRFATGKTKVIIIRMKKPIFKGYKIVLKRCGNGIYKM